MISASPVRYAPKRCICPRPVGGDRNPVQHAVRTGTRVSVIEAGFDEFVGRRYPGGKHTAEKQVRLQRLWQRDQSGGS